MEQQLFTQVIGQTVELSQCQKDGDLCCSFHAVDQATQLKTT